MSELSSDLPCGDITTSVGGTITGVNSTLLRWLGRSHAPTRFQDLLNIVGKIYYETHLVPHLTVGEHIEEVALDLLHADGSSVPVLLNAQVLRASTGQVESIRYAVFPARERRRFERELIAARREADQANRKLSELNLTLEERVKHEVAERLKTEAALRQAQKMEALGQLTGGVAHDFNNLLTVVLGGLDSVSRFLENTEVTAESARARRATNMGLQGARSAAALTHRLLAFARQQPLDPKPIEVNRVVASMSELLRRTLGESIALETVLGGGLWNTEADESQLQNAILNLAVNARDAMPKGGLLTIETANTALDERYVSSLALSVPAGQYVCITVTDTGFGMDAETLERVFEPFFTTKEAGKGTGLGLSQVYGFVRQSGGHVKLYSEIASGTSVKIYLPRFTGTEKKDPISTPFVAVAPSRGESVLVVEDEPLVREHAIHALEELGYRVHEAANATLALEALQRDPAISILFTDLVLPGGVHGEELAARARALRPELRVLFTTGYARNSMVHQQRLPANARFLSKPYTLDELARELRRLIEGTELLS